MQIKKTGNRIISKWMRQNKMHPFAFQEEAWHHIAAGNSGIINAPTGCGKTFSVFLGVLINFINTEKNWRTKKGNGLQLLWISPLRSLATDIARSMEFVISSLEMPWRVSIRNGDTSMAERNKQKTSMPEILIITPESLHLLFAQKNNETFFKTLQVIAVDEWHELLGSKRGVQTELAVCRLCNIGGQLNRSLQVWGISATIGNIDEAKEVLLAPVQSYFPHQQIQLIKAQLDKKVEVISILPDEIEKFPWYGHLGIRMAEKLVPIIEQSNTTLIFINTRGMSETWYQTLLTVAPQLAGVIALHHGSIEKDLRAWVEDALHQQKIKAVVCTASLDLGVDFRPVDTVIQVGSPKGVARFIQRAGRSGHSPGEVSRIYFLPAHSLELVEAAALRAAITNGIIESKQPLLLCFDVLIQYLCTLAIGGGFNPQKIYNEVKQTFCFREMNENEWNKLLQYLTNGGPALQQYDEYKKTENIDGNICIKNRRIALRHRLNIGTIVSDAMMKVQLQQGSYIGMIEEWFVSRLQTGDAFIIAGRAVELISTKDMTAIVKKSNSKKAIVPSWMGGRMSLTANLGHVLRETFNTAGNTTEHIEMQCLQPLFEMQQALSHIPRSNELLIEQITDKDGYHLMVYPFEGRQIHEAISAILAWRISCILPITFSIAMNDYGFELLSDKPIPVDDGNVYELFNEDNLLQDIQRSINNTEMAMRRFRDIAVIGGLIAQSLPGEQKKARHLQASASLLFKVFSEFDADNILLKQAYQEVLDQQMEEARLRGAFQRIQSGKIILTWPKQYTPLSFPIIADGLNRNNLSSEQMEQRIRRMQEQALKNLS